MKKISFPSVFCVGLLSILVFSCRKQEDSPVAVPENPLLELSFENSYLTLPEIDSAVFTWSDAAGIHRRRLEFRTDSLYLPLRDFPAAVIPGKLELYGAREYARQYQGIWVRDIELPAARSGGMVIPAPVEFQDITWKPRVRLNDAIGHSAVIGLRPDDPFFKIGATPRVYPQVELERSYWNTVGGVSPVASKLWDCRNDCIDQPDESFFADLPARIAGRSWNHISLTVAFRSGDPSMGDWLLGLEHEP